MSTPAALDLHHLIPSSTSASPFAQTVLFPTPQLHDRKRPQDNPDLLFEMTINPTYLAQRTRSCMSNLFARRWAPLKLLQRQWTDWK